MPEAVVVVPCFNEERRLRDDDFVALVRDGELRLLFVDDGSTDATASRVRAMADRTGGRIALLQLPENRGKGGAVRAGLLHALTGSPAAVGYIDADLSTPPEEVLRLHEALERPGVAVVMGARIRLLGTQIRREAIRHYLGRVFATVASLVLRLPVYDTQCGAKFFRVGEPLRRALVQPFRSRWAFDVELIGRLVTGSPALSAAEFLEVPLVRWTDVSGSRLGSGQMVGAAIDLMAIAVELRRKRRGATVADPARG
jgi:glycosyltransferase involved in cell wall biosynthesis